MDITQRTVSALGKRDDAIQKWLESDTAKATKKNDISDYKIKFDTGSMLLAAVSSNDIEEAIRLLKLGCDVNFSNADGMTSLHQACIDENLEMVKLLMKYGAKPNIRDHESWTPFHAAASTSSLEVIKYIFVFSNRKRYLVENGADLAAVTTDGELPVDLAEEDDIKNYLIGKITEQKINCDKARMLEHETMLADVKKWIASGEVPDIRDQQGATALHVAASKNYLDILELILKKTNFDVNIKDYDGWTPLHAAVYWKQNESINLLLSHHADHTAKTLVGLQPIDLADDDTSVYFKGAIRKHLAVSNAFEKKRQPDRSDKAVKKTYPHMTKSPKASALKTKTYLDGSATAVQSTKTKKDLSKLLDGLKLGDASSIPRPNISNVKQSSISDESGKSDVSSYEAALELTKPPIRPPTTSKGNATLTEDEKGKYEGGPVTPPDSIISREKGIPKPVSEHDLTPFKVSSNNFTYIIINASEPLVEKNFNISLPPKSSDSSEKKSTTISLPPKSSDSSEKKSTTISLPPKSSNSSEKKSTTISLPPKSSNSSEKKSTTISLPPKSSDSSEKKSTTISLPPKSSDTGEKRASHATSSRSRESTSVTNEKVNTDTDTDTLKNSSVSSLMKNTPVLHQKPTNSGTKKNISIPLPPKSTEVKDKKTTSASLTPKSTETTSTRKNISIALPPKSSDNGSKKTTTVTLPPKSASPGDKKDSSTSNSSLRATSANREEKKNDGTSLPHRSSDSLFKHSSKLSSAITKSSEGLVESATNEEPAEKKALSSHNFKTFKSSSRTGSSDMADSKSKPLSFKQSESSEKIKLGSSSPLKSKDSRSNQDTISGSSHLHIKHSSSRIATPGKQFFKEALPVIQHLKKSSSSEREIPLDIGEPLLDDTVSELKKEIETLKKDMDNLIKENKRLQQENSTLIKVMATYRRSRNITDES